MVTPLSVALAAEGRVRSPMTSCCFGSLPNWLLQGPRGAGGAQGGGQNGGGCHPPPLPPGGADLAGLGGGQKVLGDGRLLLRGKAEGV